MHIHSKGQMVKNGMNLLLEEEWAKHPCGPLKQPALLVCKEFGAHVTKATKMGVTKLNMQLTVIP
jgi:hypothetical protein